MSNTKPLILLVEDEELLRAGVQEMLEIQGYEVVTAHNGCLQMEVTVHGKMAHAAIDRKSVV